jgi:hypothetical protein
MIANPSLLSYRYDPYAKSFTRESYDHKSMRELRSHAITQLASAETVGVILGISLQSHPHIIYMLTFFKEPLAVRAPPKFFRPVSTSLKEQENPSPLSSYPRFFQTCWQEWKV